MNGIQVMLVVAAGVFLIKYVRGSSLSLATMPNMSQSFLKGFNTKHIIGAVLCLVAVIAFEGGNPIQAIGKYWDEAILFFIPIQLLVMAKIEVDESESWSTMYSIYFFGAIGSFLLFIIKLGIAIFGKG